jgi:hypothetical protein
VTASGCTELDGDELIKFTFVDIELRD